MKDSFQTTELKKRISLRKQNTFIYSEFENVSSSIYRPQYDQHNENNKKNEKMWELMGTYLPRTIEEIQRQFIQHIEYTQVKTRFNFTLQHAYQAISCSVRDRLIEQFNDTHQQYKLTDCKQVSYFSLEFLIGRCLQNALINIDLERKYKEALQDLGYRLEDLYEEETDAALGNGGLGRLAACFLDSMATLNYPAWGYGLRYNYGIFKQIIQNGAQIEVPDYWLDRGYPWEIERHDVQYPIRFYGYIETDIVNGKVKKRWRSGECCKAVAYDNPIPGYDTANTISLRLWRSMPLQAFDLTHFNQNDYQESIRSKQRAEVITSVLYPKDDTYEGKELRLKQEYLLVSASIQDLMRRFKDSKQNKQNWSWEEFPRQHAVQLNDTHPALAPIELFRLLVDIEDVDQDKAYDITYNTFSYTNHTLLPEALEKWGIDIIQNLLPRHMEIIYLVNFLFLQKIQAKYPGDERKLQSMSCIEEGQYKKVRMANCAIILSHKVNGVAALHTELVKSNLFNDFYQYKPNKFINKTNGVTQRRWIRASNPPLAQFYNEQLGDNEWLVEMKLLEQLLPLADNQQIRQKWKDIKFQAKQKLAKWVKYNCNIDIDPNALFDIQVKRIHEYKRQLMNILQVIKRYLDIKNSDDKNKFLHKVFFYGGKAAPGYYQAKRVIKLINAVAYKINNDPDIGDILKVVYLPNYKVSNAEIIIPASDISNHISTAGLEASGTSNMKFIMNGGLIVGTMDGANVEICEEVGRENIFIFGETVDNIDKSRERMRNLPSYEYIPKSLQQVITCIKEGTFGYDGDLIELVDSFSNQNDYYLVAHDFESFYKIQDEIDKTYKNEEKWIKMSMANALKSSKFSSDRTIHEYAQQIWDIKPITIPRPCYNKEERFKAAKSKIQMTKSIKEDQPA